jgi:hypothetical protein
VGVTIEQIEANECHLPDDQSGVCCADVTANKVRLIVDGTLGSSLGLTVNITPIVDEVEAEDILRIGFSNDDLERERSSTTKMPDDTAPEAAAPAPAPAPSTDDEQVNFIDDTDPAEFHLRFNMPRSDSLAVDAQARALLEATRRLQEANNLTDLEAGIGLRSQFNSDTSEVIDSHCPWTPAPTCDPNQVMPLSYITGTFELLA